MPKSVALNLNEEQLPTSKKCFVNDIRHFREQALGMFSVKKCYLFEGVSPSFSILAELLKCAQNAHKVSKIDLLQIHHNWRMYFLPFPVCQKYSQEVNNRYKVLTDHQL